MKIQTFRNIPLRKLNKEYPTHVYNHSIQLELKIKTFYEEAKRFTNYFITVFLLVLIIMLIQFQPSQFLKIPTNTLHLSYIEIF